MTTTIIRVRGVEAPDTLPIVDVSDEEFGIIAIPGLIDWWRADTEVTGSGSDFEWRGRKNGYRLTPTSATAPTVVQDFQNDCPALYIQGTSAALGSLYDPDDLGLWPANADYTVACVAAIAPGDNGVTVGTTATGGGANFLVRGSSNGSIALQHQTPALVTASNDTGYDSGNLVMMIASYDFTAKAARLIINQTDVKNITSGVTVAPVPARLRVGAGGPVGTPYGSLDGGHFAELLTFGVALHRAEHAASLALLQSYLMTRYAIS